MKNQNELLRFAFNGDESAVELANILGGISQIWDDLIDGDNPVSKAEINEMMLDALVQLPRNRFYLQHKETMDVLIEQAIDTWHEANDLEARGELLLVAYTIRSAITPVVIRMAYLANAGRQRGREMAYLIRKAVYDEPFDAYVAEILGHGVHIETQGPETESLSSRSGAGASGAGRLAALQDELSAAGSCADRAHAKPSGRGEDDQYSQPGCH